MLPASHPSLSRSAPVMRVLMFSLEYFYYQVGGLGAHMRGLAPRLANHVALDLVLPRFDGLGPDLEPLGAFGCIHRVDAPKPAIRSDDLDRQIWHGVNDALNAYVTRRIDGGVAYDLIHAHDWLTGYVANDLKRRYDLPYIVTIHATEWGRQQGALSIPLSERIAHAERHMVHRADGIIACSEFMRREIRQALEAAGGKIVVVPNGVESERLVTLRAIPDGALVGVAETHAPLVFFVGRMEWPKGPDLLARAMRLVLDAIPQARAVIAGKGEYLEAVRQLCRDLQIDAQVSVPGFISDQERDDCYANADVAVFPSRYEPFGIVALEAMAAGVPVVVSGHSGLGEVVENGVTGLHFQATSGDDGASAQSLAAAILDVLRDREAAAARARRARQTAIETYNWEHIAELTLCEYQRLLQRLNWQVSPVTLHGCERHESVQPVDGGERRLQNGT